MQVKTIGLDIAKSWFQVHGIDDRGQPVLRKKLARSKVVEFFAALPSCTIGIEAGGGAHYWARELAKYGHTVRLMPPQYVKPYVKTNKHDAADAEAICEAVQRPGMRFVPVKDMEQQSLTMLHRVRDQLIGQRTATINALRGHMAELGIVAARGQGGLAELRLIIGDLDDGRVPPLGREMLQMLVVSLRQIEEKVADLDRRLIQLARAVPSCARLVEVPGIGPVISTALVAAVADGRTFRSGRHLAAWIGLVPRQHSSGGKERTLGLSKRGDGYLRRQLVHGARSVVRVARGRDGGLWSWINRLLERRPLNVVVAAVANKLARIAWALLARNDRWRTA